MISSSDVQQIAAFLAVFCFGYPFVMAWYWIAGSLLFYFIRERKQPPYQSPPTLSDYPLVSVLLPCFNESEQVHETLAALDAIAYPNYEVIAINDGSKDDTLSQLEAVARNMPRLRIANLVTNQGKSTALNVGLQMARGELIVCIDGDALIDPHALTWFVGRFLADPKLGGATGNPRIRNRSTLLGKLQVGEFSSIVGMIKRTQTVFGSLFTVSGVICAFRKQAVIEAGMWNPAAMTDDVDLTLRIQVAGWHVTFEPHALCWILMPEQLRGLWRQRVRWAEGGAQAAMSVTFAILRQRAWRLWMIWLNFFISSLWAYAMIASLLLWLGFTLAGVGNPFAGPVPEWWGTILTCTYLLQAAVGLTLDSRYERGMLSYLLWIIWYPLAFWIIQTLTAVTGIVRAVRRPRSVRGTWISPDRGIR
jgi:biofilm PGA synthesis N-glycosyltransferase PgaC